MSQVFISYRRLDSAYVTDRLYDSLVRRFGKDVVFKDVDSIAMGEDFRQKIFDAIGACDSLIVVIGSKWLSVTDDAGHYRLENRDDYVRMEIEAALERGISIIPVLIDGASMPTATALPFSMSALSLRNTASLRPDPDFDADLKKISDRIAEVLYRPSSESAGSIISTLIDLTNLKNYWRTRMAIKNGEPLFERDAKTIRAAGHLGPWSFNIYKIVLAGLPSLLLAWTLDLFWPLKPPELQFAPNVSEAEKQLVIETARVFGKMIVPVFVMITGLGLILLAWVASWASIRRKDSTAAKRRQIKNAFLYYDGALGLYPQTLLTLSFFLVLYSLQRSIESLIYWACLVSVIFIALGWGLILFWSIVPKKLFVLNGYSPRRSFILWRKQVENPAPWGKYLLSMYFVGSIGSWFIIIGLSVTAYYLARLIAYLTI